MPAINSSDKHPTLDGHFDETEEAMRGGRFLALIIAAGLFVWVVTVFALGAWAT